MPSTREIRRRIRSVKNISQVTRAMQMVAASKMRRAQEQVLATRPYTEKAWHVLSNLAAQRGVDEEAHPLLQVRVRGRDELVPEGLHGAEIPLQHGLKGAFLQRRAAGVHVLPVQ